MLTNKNFNERTVNWSVPKLLVPDVFRLVQLITCFRSTRARFQRCRRHILERCSIVHKRKSSTQLNTFLYEPISDMGLGKSEKGGKWCGGLGAAVGPQWGPGAKPLVGVWGQYPQKLKVFSVCHHKKHHSGAWKSDICKSASFMFRPDIYLVILKIALKMSFWCSKNKILAKVSNSLTVGIFL